MRWFGGVAMTPRNVSSAGYLACGTLTVIGAPLLSSDTPAYAVGVFVAALLCLVVALASSQRGDVADTCHTRRETLLEAVGASLADELQYRSDLRRAQLLADVIRMRELARSPREEAPAVSGVRAVVRTASEVHEATLPGRPGKRGAK